MDFLGFMGVRVIYLTEYPIQSYIVITVFTVKTDSGYIAIPPSTTRTCPVM
jgi:hypothetical protein